MEYFIAMEDIKEKKKQERGVVHLLLKATGENFYYGNLKALFDNHEYTENDKSLGVAYNYVKNFDFSNPIERYASGELDFPPQRLHNIKIELWREETDPATGVTQSVFYVEYNIYRNEGDFRADMSYDTAPLSVTVTEANGNVLITEVDYRYN